jgi:hypothetical protein
MPSLLDWSLAGTRSAHRVYLQCGDGFTAPLTMTLAGLLLRW